MRGAGMVMVVLALIIQTFAVISPPEATLAESPNDIIRGGFTSKQQFVDQCVNNTQDVKTILDYYGVTCTAVSEKATTVFIKSNAADYHSLGRTPVSNPSPRNKKNWAIYQVKIDGVAEPLWMKDVQYWDSGAYSSYKVLKMTNKDGRIIMIMYDCGNIVTTGKYPPPAPKPIPTPTPVVTPTPKPTPVVTPTTKPVPVSYPCPAAQTDSEATACLTFNKSASNQTRGISNAHNTTANAGDVITYTLTAKNTGKVEFKDFVFNENLADVLEYADMNDFGGGTLSPNQHLVWPKRTIPANGTIKVQFNVKVKSPIPSTPQSSSDPGSYDLCMVNVFYGETVKICVKAPVSKQVEVVATTLPKTGPGTSIVVSLVVVSLMGYFFARNKLMVEELEIVRDEFATGGAV